MGYQEINFLFLFSPKLDPAVGNFHVQMADLPRMSSDVGASRIWNRLLDAAFDNSDRRKHGMGIVGRIVTRRQRRVTRRPPESNRKRKLGGNAGDHRPYFTYWITVVQVLVLFISILTYGVGPIGIDLFKKAASVSVLFISRWVCHFPDFFNTK